MRISPRLLSMVLVPWIVAGCAGPEQKLARGIRNVTEFARMGEIARSIEQTTVWEGSQKGITTGFIRGFNRSVARTVVGAFEVATFFAPWPSKDEDGWTYEACYTPDGPLYPDISVATYTEPWGGLRLTEDPATPDSYFESWPASPVFNTDTEMGVTGGSIIPFFPLGAFKLNEQ